MARTAEMKLLELMVLKEDISSVIEYIGKNENFQFQTKLKDSPNPKDISEENLNIDLQFYEGLSKAYAELGFNNASYDIKNCRAPKDEDRKKAADLIAAYTQLKNRVSEVSEESAKVNDAYKEAMAFSNLQVSYSELEHLSFLSLRIGRIPENQYEDLKDRLEGSAVVIKLGNDCSHVLVASSKKGRFALDAELKNHNFVELAVPADFKGVPESALKGLEEKKNEADSALQEIIVEKLNFAETHRAQLEKLLGCFSIAVQIDSVISRLESTELVYRITGWIPSSETEKYMKGLDELTEGRIAIRAYEPFEVPSVMSGKEQVPVKLKHGKFVKSFERMIFSYGSPIYGSIDPTPFVAVFFTILFGIMFGDCGQGLVSLLWAF